MAKASRRRNCNGGISMDMKWENGGIALGPNGLPQRVSGLEEALQNAAMRLRLPRGSIPYAPDLGSGLAGLDPQEENSVQRAWALAGEALLPCPGVEVGQAMFDQEAWGWTFTITTPEGTGQVAVPGKEQSDGQV